MGELGELRELRELDTSLVIVAEVFVVQGLGDDADELVGDVVGEEITEVHDGSVVFSGEPRFLLSLAVTADVAVITSWDFFTSTKVLPKAVFEKRLGETEFNEASVCPYRQGFGTVEQTAGVDNAEEGHLLLPYFEHGVVEGEDEFLTFLLLLVIAILWGHSEGRCRCQLQFGNRRTRSQRRSIGRFPERRCVGRGRCCAAPALSFRG